MYSLYLAWIVNFTKHSPEYNFGHNALMWHELQGYKKLTKETGNEDSWTADQTICSHYFEVLHTHLLNQIL